MRVVSSILITRSKFKKAILWMAFFNWLGRSCRHLRTSRGVDSTGSTIRGMPYQYSHLPTLFTPIGPLHFDKSRASAPLLVTAHATILRNCQKAIRHSSFANNPH